jgi:hypothetical protein
VDPVNQKHWLNLEREAAELVAARFSLTFTPSRHKFAYMDGLMSQGGNPTHITEIKVSDYKPGFSKSQGFFRLNGVKIRRGYLLSFKHNLPFIVVAYCGGVGVFIWRITDRVGIPEFKIKFTQERRPVKAGRYKVKKEIARLPINKSYYFCK